MSLANISIVGNLVRPPEQMYFASGRVKTTLVVAVNAYSKEKGETADFYKVETWGKLAELAGKYLLKGNQVTVSGRLWMDHWTDKQGANRVTPVVRAEQLSFPPRFRASPQESSAQGAIVDAAVDAETATTAFRAENTEANLALRAIAS